MSAIATLDRATHTYTDSEGGRVALCVSDVLSLSGICQPYPEIPSVMNHVEHARMLGEAVHEWCEYLDNGGADIENLDDTEVLPYVMAYQRFREKHEPEWEYVETSFSDQEIDCAGTPDRIGTILRGKSRIPVIADIKTPQAAAKYWPLQLSGYQHLSRRLDCLLYVVHLASDASFKLRPYESDIPTFLAAVKVADWRLKNGAKCKASVLVAE